MSCLLTSGYPLMCRSGIGGVSNIFIGTYNGPQMTMTLGTSSNAGQITAFGGATVSFYTFNQPLETANYTSTGVFSTENGTSFYEQVVDFTLMQLSASTGLTINTLGQGVWRVIVLDQMGNYYLLGSQNGMRVTGATPQAGKAQGDLNGAVITMGGKEPLCFYQVTSAAALSVISA